MTTVRFATERIGSLIRLAGVSSEARMIKEEKGWADKCAAGRLTT